MEELARRFWEISQTAYAFDSPWTISQFVSDMRQPHSHYFSEETEIIAFLGFHQVCDEIEKFGFQEIGIRKKYYQHPQEDAVLMSLKVGNADE